MDLQLTGKRPDHRIQRRHRRGVAHRLAVEGAEVIGHGRRKDAAASYRIDGGSTGSVN
jgi:hypothetical protein